MTDKFNIRDFLVYFISGSVFIVSVLLPFYDNSELRSLLVLISKLYIELFIFLSIPILYVMGHLINSIDFILNRVGQRKIIKKIKPIFLILNGHRITYEYEANKETADSFWNKVGALQLKNAFSSTEYWLILNDLHKVMHLTFSISMVIAIIYAKYILFVVFLILSILMWYRAKVFAKFFVKNVRRNFDLLKQYNP